LRAVCATDAAVEKGFRRAHLVSCHCSTGTVMFLADLVRHLSLPLRPDFIGVSARRGHESGELVFANNSRLDVRDETCW